MRELTVNEVEMVSGSYSLGGALSSGLAATCGVVTRSIPGLFACGFITTIFGMDSEKIFGVSHEREAMHVLTYPTGFGNGK